MQLTSNQVIKAIKELRSDCSTGADHVLVKFIKLVTTDLVSPLTNVINTCIETLTFPSLWKIEIISSIPKVDRNLLWKMITIQFTNSLKNISEISAVATSNIL